MGLVPQHRATLHKAIDESRMVQTAIQSRSGDPKNIGAKIVQSWMELNVAPEAPTVAGKSSR